MFAVVECSRKGYCYGVPRGHTINIIWWIWKKQTRNGFISSSYSLGLILSLDGKSLSRFIMYVTEVSLCGRLPSLSFGSFTFTLVLEVNSRTLVVICNEHIKDYIEILPSRLFLLVRLAPTSICWNWPWTVKYCKVMS